MTASRRAILDAIIDAYQQGRPITVATLVGKGRYEKALTGKGHSESWVEQAENATGNASSPRKPTAIAKLRQESGAEFQVAFETIRPKASIVVLGAGHVGQAVALIGSLAGYSVTVVDDRSEFLTQSRFPNAQIHLLSIPFEEAGARLAISSSSAIVIVTRGHSFDEICLRQFVDSPAAYIGMIGSRRRVIAVYDRLARSGISKEQLERVHAPIGLTIGATSPQEIGVAIVAEIIQTMRLK
ncbi:MAG TPA: XdhC family protein [Blastocatellia bacterium]|nr:XdhC family protein [Blastocatellia bacterium]